MGLRILPVNFFDQATIAVTPAAVATMPETNLQSNVRSTVWRSTRLAAQVITGTWGNNALNISSWGIWPADKSSLIGAQVRVKLWSDVAKVTLSYDSGVLDFFPFSGVAYNVFLWGIQSWGVDNADRTARLAPLVKYFSGVAASAFEITISNAGAVDTPYFESSRIWLADYVEAPWTALYGAAPAWQSASQHSRAVGGSLRRLRRAKWRALHLETVIDNEPDRATWFDLTGACPPDVEIVLSCNLGDGTRKERDFTVKGSLEVLNPFVFESSDFHRLQLAIVES